VKTPPDIFDDAFLRTNAIMEAKQALGIEDRYRNYYQCEECDVEWTMLWSCGCDDECPDCRKDYTPYDSVNLDEDDDDA